jgi:hypothetical protein
MFLSISAEPIYAIIPMEISRYSRRPFTYSDRAPANLLFHAHTR